MRSDPPTPTPDPGDPLQMLAKWRSEAARSRAIAADPLRPDAERAHEAFMAALLEEMELDALTQLANPTREGEQAVEIDVDAVLGLGPPRIRL